MYDIFFSIRVVKFKRGIKYFKDVFCFVLVVINNNILYVY